MWRGVQFGGLAGQMQIHKDECKGECLTKETSLYYLWWFGVFPPQALHVMVGVGTALKTQQALVIEWEWFSKGKELSQV